MPNICFCGGEIFAFKSQAYVILKYYFLKIKGNPLRGSPLKYTDSKKDLEVKFDT
jgi:hypothetical protein